MGRRVTEPYNVRVQVLVHVMCPVVREVRLNSAYHTVQVQVLVPVGSVLWLPLERRNGDLTFFLCYFFHFWVILPLSPTRAKASRYCRR